MAEDAMPQTVAVPATTSPAAPAQTSDASATQTTTQTVDQGGITDADFQHPEYGAKFKNAYTGMQKAQQEAAEAKKARQGLESGVAAIRTMIFEDPAVAAAMVRNLESKGEKVPAALKAAAEKAAAKQEEDDDDTRPLTRADEKRLREEWLAQLSTRDAESAFMRHLGEGDIGKGSSIYHKDAADLFKIMDAMSKAPLDQQLILAHELLTARRAAQRPTQTETQPAATTDLGRANGAPAGATAPVEGVPTEQQWLAAAGFSSEAEFHRAMRGET